MSDPTPLAEALSHRARIALGAHAVRDPVVAHVARPGLVETLRHHLLAGETHYPVRPGMTELREMVDDRVASLGCPSRGASSVLITAGEGESLFVTLLGLGVFPGGALIGERGASHQALLDWMEVPIGFEAPWDSAGTVARYREVDGSGRQAGESVAPVDHETIPSVVVTGGALFGAHPPTLDPAEIVIGSFGALDGMSSFELGFVVADPAVVKRVTTWKQASSICSPAPSQRAALWALGARP